MKVENPSCLFLEGDGKYEIRYQDVDTHSIYINTSFHRDTTAPFLTFSKEIGAGKIKGPIRFFKTNAEDRVYLSYNGYTAETMIDELTEAGRYGLEVVDPAGNSRWYYLEISSTSNLFNKKMVILTLIFLLGIGAMLFIQSKDDQVI